MGSCHDFPARSPPRQSRSTLPTPPSNGRDTTMVSVPLSLLLPPERASEAVVVRDRWSEALAGDLLAAIRSAWGEESIGAGPSSSCALWSRASRLTPGLEPGRRLSHPDLEAGAPAVRQIGTPWAAARFPRAPPAAARLQLHDVVARQGRQDCDEPSASGCAMPAGSFGLLGPACSGTDCSC